MRRGAGKSKTENEKDAAPEGEEAGSQGNGDTVVSASGGESDKEDKNTAAATTGKKRKGKRGKKEETSNPEDEAQNAEPVEKKAKRSTRNVKTTEGTTEDQGEEYEVEKIVEMKESRGKRLFKIQWKGYGSESDTWEEEQDLNCPELIKEFVSQLPDKGKKRNAKSTDSKTKKPRVSFNEADEKEYEVAQVMEMHRKKNGKREFLVHWKGFSHDDDTWEPEENLNCEELIEEFMKKNKTSNTKGDRKGTARAGKGKKAARRSNKQK